MPLWSTMVVNIQLTAPEAVGHQCPYLRILPGNAILGSRLVRVRHGALFVPKLTGGVTCQIGLACSAKSRGPAGH
jgi:hypothetical protein